MSLINSFSPTYIHRKIKTLLKFYVTRSWLKTYNITIKHLFLRKTLQSEISKFHHPGNDSNVALAPPGCSISCSIIHHPPQLQEILPPEGSSVFAVLSKARFAPYTTEPKKRRSSNKQEKKRYFELQISKLYMHN